MYKKLRMFNNTGRNGLIIVIVLLLLGASAAACDTVKADDGDQIIGPGSWIVFSSTVVKWGDMLGVPEKCDITPPYVVKVDTVCVKVYRDGVLDNVYYELDTIRAPKVPMKIPVWLDSAECRVLMELLHPTWEIVDWGAIFR